MPYGVFVCRGSCCCGSSCTMVATTSRIAMHLSICLSQLLFCSLSPWKLSTNNLLLPLMIPVAGLSVALPGDWCVDQNNKQDPNIVCSTQAPVCDEGYSGKCIALPAEATQAVTGPSECLVKLILVAQEHLLVVF